MLVRRLVKPGPIILAIWLISYLIWAFYLPYEWIQAIRKFLSEVHLRPEIIKSLHLPAEFANSVALPVEPLLVGGLLIVTLIVGFAMGLNWFKWRVLRDLF